MANHCSEEAGVKARYRWLLRPMAVTFLSHPTLLLLASSCLVTRKFLTQFSYVLWKR